MGKTVNWINAAL